MEGPYSEMGCAPSTQTHPQNNILVCGGCWQTINITDKNYILGDISRIDESSGKEKSRMKVDQKKERRVMCTFHRVGEMFSLRNSHLGNCEALKTSGGSLSRPRNRTVQRPRSWNPPQIFWVWPQCPASTSVRQQMSHITGLGLSFVGLGAMSPTWALSEVEILGSGQAEGGGRGWGQQPGVAPLWVFSEG